jgi:P27 family predicted phage terminase small subunit
MRGPPPKPTQLKLLRGNPGHQRLNRDEPQPTRPSSMPEPLPFLSPYAQEEWWRAGRELYELGLLTGLDIQPFAVYCQTYAHWRAAEEALAKAGELVVHNAANGPIANPLLKIAQVYARDLVRYAGEFGLSPSARARVRTSIAGAASKFDGMLS